MAMQISKKTTFYKGEKKKCYDTEKYSVVKSA